MKKILLILILLLPFTVKASSYIVIDTDSNRIIDGNNIHEVRSIASISKIMTAIIAIESNKLDDEVIVSPIISKSYGSGIYIKVGEKLKLKDLVMGLILRSGNDAALVISDYVGGNENNFVDLMNKKAKELKMINTTFNNPSGLDEKDGNYSTSYDMGLLISYCMKNNTFREIISTKKYKLKTNMNTYVWTNKNKLLHTYKYITGGKTGYTKKAKRTLVTTATKNNVNLAVVTLNDPNDFENHKNMYEKYFKIYSNYKILKNGTIKILSDDKIYYLKTDFNYTLNKNENNNIIIKYKLFTKPKNSNAGYAYVLLNNKVIHKQKIYIKNSKNIIEKIREWLND